MIVRPPRTRRGQAVEDCGFECSRSGNRSIVLGVRLRFGFAIPPFWKYRHRCGRPRRATGGDFCRGYRAEPENRRHLAVWALCVNVPAETSPQRTQFEESGHLGASFHPACISSTLWFWTAVGVYFDPTSRSVQNAPGARAGGGKSDAEVVIMELVPVVQVIILSKASRCLLHASIHRGVV